MFHHAPKEGLIDPSRSIQIGIRTEYNQGDHAFQVVTADVANDSLPGDIAEKISQTVGTLPVYVTFDIDCLDPAYAPGTGTPVCGGLSSDKALRILRSMARKGISVIGCDVVEVSPSYDHANITSLAAASIALEMLYLVATDAKIAKSLGEGK